MTIISSFQICILLFPLFYCSDNNFPYYIEYPCFVYNPRGKTHSPLGLLDTTPVEKGKVLQYCGEELLTFFPLSPWCRDCIITALYGIKPLYSFPRVARAKNHRLSSLNNKNLFSLNSEKS